MVGPAGDELAQVYGIREPYAARRSETRGKETGDENGEMEKEREEKEKGRAARNGCDIAQPGCLRQARIRSSPISAFLLFFVGLPVKRYWKSCIHIHLSVLTVHSLSKMSAEPSSSIQAAEPVVVSVAPSKNGRTPGKAHKSAKTALRRSYISPSVKTPFEKRMEKEKAQQAAKQLERELKEEKETDRQRFVCLISRIAAVLTKR